MSLSRRGFLKQSLGVSALVATGASVPAFLARTAVSAPAEAHKKEDTILVVVQLAGGNDGLNTVVPYTDVLYAKNRPTLRLPPGELHKIDARLGFHPQMGAFHRLYQEGLLSVLQGVGYPNPNQNHPQAMRAWQAAETKTAEAQTGWLGRAVDQLYRPASGQVPAAYVGHIQPPFTVNAEKAIVPWIQSLDQYTWRGEASARVRIEAATPANGQKRRPGEKESLLQFVENISLTAYASSKQVETAARPGAASTDYPNFQLAALLRTIAQLIRAEVGIRIFYTELGGNEPGGFDTHAGQTLNHGALLEQLSESIAAFVKDLKRDNSLDRVLLMTFSEFGRTVLENGRRGTDHGAAQPLFVVGGKVRGGLVGVHPPLDDMDGVGLRAHTDFRRVYSTILDRWLHIDSRAILGEGFSHVEFLQA